MTIPEGLPRPGAVLVRTERPPEPPVDGWVDVRPGWAATFDGGRRTTPVDVTADGRRRRFDVEALPAAVAAVRAHLRDAAVVRLGNRATLRALWAEPTAAAVERRLAAAVRRADATLLTWTDGRPASRDRELYDVVLP